MLDLKHYLPLIILTGKANPERTRIFNALMYLGNAED